MTCSAHDYSLNRLRRFNYNYSIVDRQKGVYLVGGFHFCPKSGKFWNEQTGKRGAGVYKLIDALRKQRKKMLSNYPPGQENIDDVYEDDNQPEYVQENDSNPDNQND